MRAILKLYALDWKRIYQSKMTLIIVIGLMIIPSLYAWFNILALWDPYGSTSELPIAVVSLDKGAKAQQEVVNFGDEIISNLHDNNDIGWVFEKDETAVKTGVESGKYFAGIIIPSDFSGNLISFLSGNPTHPQIEYLVNLKVNAIAPKISDKGVDSIKAEVTSNLMSEISQTVLENANLLGDELTVNRKTIEDYINLLNQTAGDLEKDQKIVDEIHQKRLEISEYQNKLEILDKYGEYETKINEIIPKISSLATHTNEIETKLENISKLSEYEGDVTKVMQSVNGVHQDIIDLNQGVSTEIDKIELKIKDLSTDNQELIEQLTTTKADLTTINEALTKLNDNLNLGKEISFENINEVKLFYENNWPDVKKQINELNTFLVADWPELNRTITDTISEVKTKSEEIFAKLISVDNEIQNVWPVYKGAISSLNENVNNATKKVDLNQVIDILMYNPKSESAFFSDPIAINETQLYPVPNYGSQSTPFYTALCLWVGGLLLVSVLKIDYYLPSQGTYTKRQTFFARQLTFITIAIFQGLIVELGNIYLLKVYMQNPVNNLLSVIFISIIFNIIIYTLTALFDNFGKVMAIILLVLSVSAGGGNFPIQLSSEFFQVINPLLPFTYAVNLLRESIGGIYVPTVIETTKILMLMGIITSVVGAFLYPHISVKITALMKKADSGHIIH